MSSISRRFFNSAGIIISAILLITSCNSLKNTSKSKETNNVTALSKLETGFVTSPDSIQTSVYWYWVSDHISKEGVIKDLHAMKKVGINRAFIGNIGLGAPIGKVKMFTDEWWEITHAALKTATELNIEIGMFNGPAWSQSGGPWIKPEQSMRYLTSSSIKLKGAQKIKIALARPKPDFQDVRVFAFPLPKDFEKSITALDPQVTSSPVTGKLKDILDKNTATGITFQPNRENYIDLILQSEFAARSITIYPSHKRMTANVDLMVKENDTFRKVKSFTIERSNDALNVGFDPYAPASASFPETKSNHFRIVFKNVSDGCGITDVEILTSPKIENYAEKTLAKMYPTPLPYWKEYQWPVQSVVNDPSVMINPESVIDISRYMNSDGILNWDVPAGEWIVRRTGMVTTGVTNSPASPEGTGLEVDKMNSEHVVSHFNAFMGAIQKRIPAQDRKTWKVVVQDSYETGGQNWTDGLIESFKQRYQYDPLPYMPVLAGDVVGSQEKSDRFLWDLRRFIADRVAHEYVAGLRKVSNANGLTTWLENYGHWGFPGEFLQYGGQSDEVGGEFWSEGDLGDIENRAASSAAHIYGKNKVSAESFTAGGRGFGRYPALMKQRGDRFFTEGINNTLLHVYIHQPYEDKLPGVNAWFGNDFNRKNTWFNDMDIFIQYLKRSNFMLQQGKYVADAAYFIGEDAPKMTGIVDPALPTGYSFDYINGEVIQNRVSVKDGRLVLPDGMNYRILVLPKLETIRPELLAKIRDLVSEGAVVMGPKPLRSPSLQGYPSADSQVQKIAAELWGNIDGQKVKMNKFGKGMVLSGMDMQHALDLIKVAPDFKADADSVLFIHRTLPEGEVYFVSNQSSEKRTISTGFKVMGKAPEWWDAITGEVRALPEFSQTREHTTIPMQLSAYESAVIVFRKNIENAVSGKGMNFPAPVSSKEITKPWTVTFDPAMRGPQQPVVFEKLVDWTKRPENEIKYYSGTAVYKQSFTVDKLQKGQKIVLELGNVISIAKVKINGIEVGGVWTAPYELDITKAVKVGENQMEVSVVNGWANRLIGDAKLPADQRKTWTSTQVVNENTPMEPSGLFGPVRITTY